MSLYQKMFCQSSEYFLVRALVPCFVSFPNCCFRLYGQTGFCTDCCWCTSTSTKCKELDLHWLVNTCTYTGVQWHTGVHTLAYRCKWGHWYKNRLVQQWIECNSWNMNHSEKNVVRSRMQKAVKKKVAQYVPLGRRFCFIVW